MLKGWHCGSREVLAALKVAKLPANKSATAGHQPHVDYSVGVSTIMVRYTAWLATWGKPSNPQNSELPAVRSMCQTTGVMTQEGTHLKRLHKAHQVV